VNGPSQYKWLAYPDRFVQQSRECIGLAGTQRGETIFDIGCGPGYLLWICRERLGCHVRGCDPLRRAPIYTELYESLKLTDCITSHVSTIEEPIPKTDAKYDVIFATWITWIGFGNWSPDELSRYLRACLDHLRPRGRMLLRFEESRFEPRMYREVLSEVAAQVGPLCYLVKRRH
jgi:cyclopropane fatty-acyl-phospholipid synthase-like methyltransferase